MNLRPYQTEAIESLASKLRKTPKMVFQLATGGGKTVTFAGITKRYLDKQTSSVLIIVHRKELLDQARRTFWDFAGLNAQVIVAGMRYVPPAKVYIAMVESLKNRIPNDIGLVIIDECFIAGTKVSNKNIEDIVIGDYVDSYNHNTGLIEKKKVIAKSIKNTYNDLLLISFQYAQFVCTQEHPIFVEGKGYIPAKDLQIKDIVYGTTNLPTMRGYYEKRRLQNNHLENKIKQKKKRCIKFLQTYLCSKLLCTNAQPKDEREKSNVKSGSSTENERFFKKNWTQTKYTGWKWTRNDSTTKNAIRRTWGRLVCRISYCNRKWIFAISLQNRLRFSKKQNSSGSRWIWSFFKNIKKERPEKNGIIAKQRVQSIEIYKQGNFREFKKSCKSNTVYNLEVEGNNNYFANGILVHNCHMGNFKKVHDWFTDKYIIGFTATPLSSDKKHPLKKDYQDIVCAIDTPELIANGFLCQNITFAPRDAVDRKNLTIKGKDFDEGLMGMEFSQPKYVRNTRLAYEKHSKGDKTIIFNVTIDHSLKVCQEFAEHGYNVRHLDGMMKKTERNKIIDWFKSTPDAILCNVGIATTGFDVPEIETVIVNRATISLVLWLQMCGRGSRVLDWKKIFKIIDLGSNRITHGDWSSPRDWENIFWNPPKPSDGNGVAPIKECPNCEAIIPAQCRTCPHCKFEIPKSEQEEAEENLLGELITMANGLDVKELMESQKHRKKYYPFFAIGKILADEAKRIVPNMNDEIFDHILNQYYEKGSEWCKANNIKWNQWHRDRAFETLIEEIEKKFKHYKINHIKQIA